MMLIMGGAFVYNACTVTGNSEERLKKGEIRAAELIIPDAHYIVQRSNGSNSTMMSYDFTKRVCMGTFQGEKYVIDLFQRYEAGEARSTVTDITEKMEEELQQCVGKRYLARLDYRRGKLFSIDVFLDEEISFTTE